MKECLVTGATGHIGNVFVRCLLDEGFCVNALVLKGDSQISLLESMGVNIIYGDICDIECLRKCIPENGIVFHLAGYIEIGSGLKDKKQLYKVNYEGTKNVADVCLEKHVEKLVYTSSVHIIELVKNAVLVEPNVFNEKKIVGHYAKSKTMSAKYVMEKVKEGLNAVIVYPSGVIGPYDYKVSQLGQLLIQIANKTIKLLVRGKYNLVDVRDVCEGILAAYEKGRIGEGYILSGHEVSVIEIYKYVCDYLGRKANAKIVPMWIAKTFAYASELWDKMFKRRPLYTRYSLYTITSNCNFSNDKAKEELGVTFRPAKDSICDAVGWFMKNMPEKFKKSVFDEYNLKLFKKKESSK